MSYELSSQIDISESIEEALSKLTDEQLNGDFDDILELMPVTNDTSCAFGFMRRSMLKKLTSKKFLVALYSILSLAFASTGSYFNGTITTLEKRFEIPTKNIGIIWVGNDVSSLFLYIVITYYGGKSHRPRWIGVGLLAIVVFCLINALPHFIFGSGSEALSLTIENGGVKDGAESEAAEKIENNKLLCKSNATDGVAAECNLADGGSLTPQILLFIAQLIAGVGQTLCSTLGFSYLDDNVKKTKKPALLSISFFMRFLGPAFGYLLASLCLKIYIAPELTPVINNKDPRWLGAWWLGWLIFAYILCLFSFTVAMLPKELPRAAVRKRIEKEKVKRGLKMIDTSGAAEDTKASIPDMIVTYKRLFRNKVFMLMNIAGIFHLFGFLPYWIYTPKIIETVYHQSASTSSFITGTLAIVFSGIGVLIGGVYISKYKPSARFLSLWHIICGILCIVGMFAFSSVGCDEGRKTLSVKNDAISICNKECHCDFVRYSPVCGTDGLTYISACHAGCKKFIATNDTKTFNECSCVGIDNYDNNSSFSWELTAPPKHSATSGPCPVNCKKELLKFRIIMCFMKFIAATGRTTNVLLSIKCISKKERVAAIVFGAMLIHIFALIPSPIFFGFIFDSVCLVSGKTCTGKGNCWLYNEESLRYVLNFSAAVFIAIGTIIDVGVWHFVKDLKLFDDVVKTENSTTNSN